MQEPFILGRTNSPSLPLLSRRSDAAAQGAPVGGNNHPGATKMNGYAAKPLTLQKINQAYALVRTADPRMTAEKWRDIAADFLAADDDDARSTRGVVTVQNDQGYILGLFCYAACDHLRHGRTLKVENLMAIDLFDTGAAIEVLLQSMTDLAQKSACTAIEVESPAQWNDNSPVKQRLSAWFAAVPNGDSEPRLRRLLRLLEPVPCRPLSPTAN